MRVEISNGGPVGSGGTGAPLREAVVELSRLRKLYVGRGASGRRAEVAAVDDVSLTVHAGELVVLLGPSGCGKTTLLRCIAGLEQPQAGEIRIGGRTVFGAADHVLVPPEQRHIGMMFQSYALWPHMTVAQNVAYPLPPPRRQDEQAAQVAQMLERLGVAGLGHRYPGELSGGQQQRVALARALIASPAVMLFDEPLSNVDAKVRRRLRAELREIKRQAGFAGVYVTHDQEEAMELADTLIVMDSGKILQSGAPREVYGRPASSFVAGFVGEINCWPARIAVGPDGSRVVTCALGSFALSAIGAAVSGSGNGEGFVAVRPEHVELVPANGDEGARSHGTVRVGGVLGEAVHLGARVECRVRVADTEVLAWLTDLQAAQTRLERGAEVELRIAPEKLCWLPS